MKNTIWNKRIPAFISLGFIAISIVITTVLVKSGVVFITRASPSDIPQNLRITNVSDNGLTISYTTEAKNVGFVNLGQDKTLGETILDNRDEENKVITQRKVHNITVKNLKPKTSYFFSITSGRTTFLNNNAPFGAVTGPVLKSPSPKTRLIGGNVILPDGNKPTEAIVYLVVENAQSISTLVNSDGSYLLKLNSLRTDDLSNYFVFKKDEDIKMLIAGDSFVSNVVLSSNLDKVPTVTLSYDYDFTISSDPITPKSKETLPFPSVETSPTTPVTLIPRILVPKKDQSFSDQRPLFSGTASPNEKVEIIIRSQHEIRAQATADANGRWKYRPENTIPPGDHVISITARDSSGILKTITQSFVVFASGSKVSESATPSATIAPKPTPTPTLTPVPTLLPTQEPTPVIEPTIPPSPPISPIPSVGNPHTVTFGFFGLVVVASSLLLLFITRRGGTS